MPESDIELIQAFYSTLDAVLRGATASELRDVKVSSYMELCADDWGDAHRVCVCVNNACYKWLERARADRRIGVEDAQLRAYRLNAFFNVNFQLI
jgi:hypothetical protein